MKQRRDAGESPLTLVYSADLSEREELMRAAAGDDEAVRRIYRAHVDRVHRMAARVMGSHDPDVEDVVQQVFIAVLESAASFDGRSKLSTWILGIAIRRALDHCRSKARRQKWHAAMRMFTFEREVSTPEHQHIARSESQRALLALEPQVRAVFVLFEVEQYTLQEISDMTGIGISTLHARLDKARKLLNEGQQR